MEPASDPKRQPNKTDMETSEPNLIEQRFKNTECRKCTILKYLFTALILGAALWLMYAVLNHNVKHQCPEKFNSETNLMEANKSCTSINCMKSAMLIAESMNKSADPCKDFYQFACGNHYKAHPTQRSSASSDQFTDAEARIITIIRDIMEKEDLDTEQIDIKRSRVLYHSCMAQDENYTTGLTSLIKLLKNIGLPPLGFYTDNSTNGLNPNLSSILARIKKYVNINYLFTISVKPQLENRTLNEIILAKPQNLKLFQLDKMSEMTRKINSIDRRSSDEEADELSEDIKYKHSFEKYFESVWKEINYFTTNYSNNYNASELQEQISHTLKFDQELVQIIEKHYETENQITIPMDVDKVQAYFDSNKHNVNEKKNVIDWKQMINEQFADVEFLTLNFTTNLIRIENIEYFNAVYNMLLKYDEIKAVHLWWKVVSTMIPFTNNKLRFYKDIFDYETTGYEIKFDQSLYCANVVKKVMGPAILYLITNDEQYKKNMKTVDEMMTNIRRAFEGIVNDTKWMDQTSKNRTLFKAQQIKTRIGYPKLQEVTLPINDYTDFNVEKNDFCGNIIRHVQLSWKNTIWKSIQSNNYYSNYTWESNPLDSNIVYLDQKNIFEIPAGIMQFPFIGHNMQVLNYGYLGSILGHEFTSGFDNNSRQFNEDGKELDWWTSSTKVEYNNRTNCLVNHYNSYKINRKSIADIAGIKEALSAYKEFVAKNGKEPELLGLEEFSDEKLFYLAFANNFCEASSTNKFRSNDFLDIHSQNDIRVNTALINFPEFNKVWGCEENLKTNTIYETCKIW